MIRKLYSALLWWWLVCLGILSDKDVAVRNNEEWSREDYLRRWGGIDKVI